MATGGGDSSSNSTENLDVILEGHLEDGSDAIHDSENENSHGDAINEKVNTYIYEPSLGLKGAGISQKVANDVYEPSVGLRGSPGKVTSSRPISLLSSTYFPAEGDMDEVKEIVSGGLDSYDEKEDEKIEAELALVLKEKELIKKKMRSQNLKEQLKREKAELEELKKHDEAVGGMDKGKKGDKKEKEKRSQKKKESGAGISQKVENDVYEPSVGLRDIAISEKRNTAVERTSLGTKDDGTKHAEEEFNSQLNNELRLVLIGKTGVGKSSTGNTILGKVAFKAKGSLKSVTTHSQSQRRQWGSKKVVVIDTPGLYDNQRSMADVKRELIRCIGMSYPGPHSFLYVISASSRQTPEEDAAFKEFVKTFGEQVYDFLIIIFVKKDELEAQTFKDFLKEELTESLMTIVTKIGEKRCFWLNNKALEKEQETVECILKTINDHLPKSYYTNIMLKSVLRPLTRQIVELQFKITPQAIRNKIEEGGALYEYLYAAGGVSLGAAAIILTPKCAIL